MNNNKLINEFNKEGIKKNYNEWIKLVYDLMIKNKKLDIVLDDSQLDYLVNELIEIINEKLHNEIELNYMEVDVFFHSFICYVLDKLQIKSLLGYTYIEPDGKRLKEEWEGVCVSKEEGSFVYYNISLFNEFMDKDIRLDERLWSIITLAHELVHIKQKEDMKEGVLTLDNYVMTLEEILRLGKFYFENYSYVRLEIDANSRAIDLLCDFYKKNHVYDEELLIELNKCMKLVTEYNVNNANNHGVIVDNVENDIMIYYSLYKSSEYIKQNPKLIQKYPLLSLVYKNEGDLYTIRELFEKRKDMLNKDIDVSELNKIYKHILLSYQSFMELDAILNEIKMYLESISNNDIFAMWILDIFNEPRETMTEEELENRIQKRILSLNK